MPALFCLPACLPASPLADVLVNCFRSVLALRPAEELVQTAYLATGRIAPDYEDGTELRVGWGKGWWCVCVCGVGGQVADGTVCGCPHVSAAVCACLILGGRIHHDGRHRRGHGRVQGPPAVRSGAAACPCLPLATMPPGHDALCSRMLHCTCVLASYLSPSLPSPPTRIPSPAAALAVQRHVQGHGGCGRRVPGSAPQPGRAAAPRPPHRARRVCRAAADCAGEGGG